MDKPRQGWAGLWNISFGFFGIQIGFALQNANMSRIFQSLGTELDNLPALWVAAPLTGLLVQPVIGHLSDRTWLGRLGRRRPYFLAGAVLAALALIAMPESTVLWFAAVMLWVLDASLNISMEPFRAFVGDMLRRDQHTAGYAVQTAFIGAGAVVGSLFPYVLDHLGVANVGGAGGIPDTVRYSFWAGGAALFAAVGWTVLTTREYAPDEMLAFDGTGCGGRRGSPPVPRPNGLWALAGAAVIAGVLLFNLEKEMLLLGGLLIAYDAAKLIAHGQTRDGRPSSAMLAGIVGDFAGMPTLMKRLAAVQFFSWSALFIMWINTTPVVAQYVWRSPDPASAGYQEAGNWVGVLFAVYNGVAAVAALTLLPWLARRIGKGRTHMVGLLCGSAGFLAFFLLRDAQALVWAEVGIGIAWASILAMPYAILASALPQAKLGVYMGLFNVFIVVPQLLVATVMGSIMRGLFPGEPVWTMLFAAAVLALGRARHDPGGGARGRGAPPAASRSRRMKLALTRTLALAAVLMAAPAAAQDYTPRPYVQITHPEWSRDAVIYELNTRHFTQQGTLAAAQAQLPRLKALGVGIIWLMPIHPVGERNRKGTLGSPYSVRDYTAVNPEFGTLADLKAFVAAAHGQGMHVILDLVANHTAWDHPWVTEHPDWYERDWKGDFHPTPWWDWSDIIDLDYSRPGVRRAMTEAMEYWVREADVDGYRADVAGYVPVDFWETARTRLDAIKPVFLLAEWQERDLHARAFDATYAWDWYNAMHDIARGKADATALYGYYSANESAWPADALRMAFTENHDKNAWEATQYEAFGDLLPAAITLSFVGEGDARSSTTDRRRATSAGWRSSRRTGSTGPNRAGWTSCSRACQPSRPRIRRSGMAPGAGRWRSWRRARPNRSSPSCGARTMTGCWHS